MSYNRRIENEIKKLIKQDYVINNNFKEGKKMHVYLLDEYNSLYIVSFLFSDEYPFKSPKVYIGKQNYIKQLADLSSGIYKKHKDYNCLCCNSILCNVWSPTCSILDIIKEVESMIKLYLNVIRKKSDLVFIKKIINKQLNMNMNGVYNNIADFL
jgi:ubiquitin-protein ligase